MTKRTALQKRARALQTERGIGYHAALNLAREQTDLRRTITATLRPGERPGRHVLTVEGRDHTVFDGDLGRCLDGWTPSPSQDVGRLFATGAGPLELVRDEQGQLEDQADAVWAGTDCRRFGANGPGIFDTHLPYLLAVVAALEAAGACIADFDLYTDEDRRMHVTLAAGPDHVPDDEDDTRRWVLAWIDDRGWFTFLEPGPGESLGSCVSELPCSLMELPEDVAAAVAADRTLVPAPRTDRPLPGTEETGRGWRPPADYVTDPEVAGEPGEVCLDLERALAAYCQHPAWLTDRKQQLAAGQ
ncbi:DUF6292 family protein (plasmid) [Streptomyces sp. NBC_01544]|uniref:DUF6292 family protein n=1 Tax=Streptomyces sp. NBC_01544 TaxID=2975871 RepID=UPI00386C82AC